MGAKSFGYTGGWQKFVVPKGVAAVSVTLNGAGSGGTKRGGQVSGQIKVTAGQTLYVQIGGAGKPHSGETGGGSAFGGGAPGGKGRGHAGGDGGGGASAVRLGSATGTILAVAGGAGGTSGDGGVGGSGGGLIGENGWPSATEGAYGNATGGTQVQGGSRGTSGLGAVYDGYGATDTALSPGGAGGGPNYLDTFGGGGGGGGFRSGGGGQAGVGTQAPGGGGGGGSNYTGGLVGYSSGQARGNSSNGSAALTWVDPAPANQPPSPPTEVLVNGNAPVDELATYSTGIVSITAKVDDPNAGQTVRIVVQFSPTNDFSKNVQTVTSAAVAQTKRTGVYLRGLSQNTRYWARIRTRDSAGLLSTNYTSVNFWTNRFPTEPILVAPADNTMISELSSVTFEWTHQDPDETSSQRAYELRWRQAATPSTLAGAWTTVGFTTYFNKYVADPGTFAPNMFHEWEVRTSDPQGTWGPWSTTSSFYISGTSTSPVLLDPIRGEAADVAKPLTLTWQFRDPDQGDGQASADIRYRPITPAGDNEWFTLLGDATTPGTTSAWTLPIHTLIPGVHYEWQARTHDTLTGSVSEWSESANFWAISTPGVSGLPAPLIETPELQGSLGQGSHRVFIYDRGGKVLRGEVTPVASLFYSRKRDDISNAIIDTNGFGSDCCELLAGLRSWMHEVVIFRDGVRVWEGPITRITYAPDSVEIEAKDVMAYVYRRIMRQGYNDAWRIVNGVELGDTTVVERASRITMNALAPDDPNILPYLTSFNFPDDAPQSRVVPDYSRTAWEEVDDLAATAGLDYVTVGRRIIYWDTHRPIGRLPEMRDENFSDPPVVSEYGMQLATDFGVTNNNGVWGLASRDRGPYGLIEQLASAYGESDGTATEALTPASRAALEKTLTSQAERNIAGRWPTPLVVRVPDNSTLNPETNVGINQLIPGVWIPLRSQGTCRDVAQWQKLDLVSVTEGSGGERISVTMSPAPNGGADPDADTAATEEA